MMYVFCEVNMKGHVHVQYFAQTVFYDINRYFHMNNAYPFYSKITTSEIVQKSNKTVSVIITTARVCV